ncbi:helix-turn-helix domain-containing protein [uncultured Reyranella sp.]|uniref:helix-turn-helix domain-containing protein n=1 Tax=uncultured Reyranella sp. TaxID=735512 RepID=UPI00259CEB6F|nr:helix-turn-helix domain-containing protein [uncultured Reyranella sp.]
METTPAAPQRLMYTTAEAAEMLALDPEQVERMCRNGSLRARKVGKAWRVPGTALVEFVEAAA